MEVVRRISRRGLLLVLMVALFPLGCNSERVAQPVSKAEAEKIKADEIEARQQRKDAKKAGMFKRKGAPPKQEPNATSE